MQAEQTIKRVVWAATEHRTEETMPKCSGLGFLHPRYRWRSKEAAGEAVLGRGLPLRTFPRPTWAPRPVHFGRIVPVRSEEGKEELDETIIDRWEGLAQAVALQKRKGSG